MCSSWSSRQQEGKPHFDEFLQNWRDAWSGIVHRRDAEGAEKKIFHRRDAEGAEKKIFHRKGAKDAKKKSD